MTEVSTHLTNPKLTSMELNNNTPSSEGSLNLMENSFPRQRSVSRASMSSASSSNSDTSEDAEVSALGDEAKSLDGDVKSAEGPNKKFDIRKARSMSDGQAGKILELTTDIFPSLPDSVLEKLGLLGENPRERMNEEELEQKFVALALAFTIDAATIKDRCERQRRYRDQTENNLYTEIDRLIEKATCIQPLCVNKDSAELLTGLLAQIDVIIRASSHAAISAERFGAVQHEERLAEAVNLMINHVTLLKQQRDSTRKQLQYTKKVLQDTNSSEPANMKTRISTSANGRIITKRRASIATISQPQDPCKSPTSPNPDIRRITRRTSDLTSRVSAFARATRPSRLELGVDLDKIKEGISDENIYAELPDAVPNQQSEVSDDSEINDTTKIIQSPVTDPLSLSLRQRIVYKCKQYGTNIQEKYEKYTEDGTLHEFFCFASLLCFMLGVIVLGNLLVEMEYSRLSFARQNTYWGNIFSHFSKTDLDSEAIKT